MEQAILVGTLITPKKKPIKQLGPPIWYTTIEMKSGKRIKKYLSEIEAERYMTAGYPVFKKMKRYGFAERY